MRRAGVLAAALCAGLSGAAAVLRVGPGAPYNRPSAAIDAAKPGDTILIAEGVWKDDVKYFPPTPDLTIRGAGADKTVLDASGFDGRDGRPHLAGRKGIWVVTGTNCVIEGISFRNARVPDSYGHNGAGLRYEGNGDLTVRGCAFAGCQNGFLCGALPEARVTFENCTFRDNGNRWGGVEGDTHNLYVGAVRELTFRKCVSDHAYKGHNLKSRAHRTTVRDCVFDDGHDGRSSYLLDCPNGGEVTVSGCRFVQSEKAENGVMVAVGEEGACPGTSFKESGNTFTDYRGGTKPNFRASKRACFMLSYTP